MDLVLLLVALCWLAVGADVAIAADDAAAAQAPAQPQIGARELFRAGGAVGIVILGLSLAMVALVVEHILSLRRKVLVPPGLAEDVREQVRHGQFVEAHRLSREEPSLLGHILSAGLKETASGHSAMEKAMEDAAAEQSARLHRKIEYLSIIGVIAPMLGLMGTVWGMMQAFLEFELKANPQVADLAPGIYKALVTTLLGLGVAVPALASFAIFRNRIDELVAESVLAADHVFAELKRSRVARRQKPRASHPPAQAPADDPFVPLEPDQAR